MNRTEAEKLGDKLVKECEAFSLCILDGNGSPHLYPMQKAMGSSMDEVLFITKICSNKVRMLRADCRAAAEYHREEQSVSLTGSIRLIEDGAQIRRMLTGELCGRLEARGFERYCVLQFVTEQWIVYNEGESMSSVLPECKEGENRICHSGL